MEYVLALAVGGGLVWLGYRVRAKRSEGRYRAESLAQMRKLCEEDIAVLADNLRRVDAEAADRPLDEDSRADYQLARKSHRTAQQEVGWIEGPDEIGKVTEPIANGHHALARVQARAVGEPVPKLRVPCFFNPQHGPSIYEVAFTPPGHGTHKVPACASDVARVRAKEKPEIREVEVGGRRVPYFEAGSALAPYGESYFTGETSIQELFMTKASWSGEGRSRLSFDRQGLRSDGMFGGGGQ
ncbi:MAG TPA: hypothetical protein VFO49_07605 [Nocardioides sp.]|nr:hypothetical protein [Nocardioides sp.]